MSYDINTLQIKSLGANTEHVPHNILNAIGKASESSGVDFSYLVNQAAAESSFNPNAKAKTSSATGLYQFIDSTWLSMVERYGDEYGIETTGLSDREILNMRKDPEAASFMAAAFASENERFLNTNWNGNVGSTELYLAHFMGASGAASFLNARNENPIQNAADLFPRAARANRNVFFDKATGEPRTLEQVYKFFDKKFQNEYNGSQTAIANAPIPPETPAQKLASSNKSHNTLYPHRLSDNIIMQKAQAMRDGRSISVNEHNSIHNLQNSNNASLFKTIHAKQLSQNDARIPKSPFFSLIAEPLDLMVLTQTVTPSKVVRDKN